MRSQLLVLESPTEGLTRVVGSDHRLSVKVSPISRSAALLIVMIGILTYYFVNDVAGIVFIALGVILYWLLYRFTRKVVKEVEVVKSKGSG
jgi:hypothetical protein